jgi:hypothetical protein
MISSWKPSKTPRCCGYGCCIARAFGQVRHVRRYKLGNDIEYDIRIEKLVHVSRVLCFAL